MRTAVIGSPLRQVRRSMTRQAAPGWMRRSAAAVLSALQAVMHRDLPVVEGYAILIVVLVMVSNLIVDLIYMYLNPKVRSS